MKKRNLNSKLIFVFMTVLTLLFLVMLIAVQIAAQIVSDNYIKKDIITSHGEISTEITEVLDEVNYGYTRMSQSDLLPELTSENKQQAFRQLIEEASISQKFVNVVLCLDDFLCSNNSYDLPKKSFGEKIMKGEKTLYLGEVSGEGYVQVGRKFQNTRHNVNGFVVFYIKTDVLNGFCADPDKVGYTQLLTSDYLVVAKSDGQNVGQTVFERESFPLKQDVSRKKVNGADSYIAVTPVNNQYNLGWYLVSVLDVMALQKDFVTLSWILSAIALVSVGVTLYVAIKIARSTVAPVNKLSQKISSVDLQDRRSFLIGAEGDELFELEKNYDEMLQRLFRLMDENKENMETQRKLEMDALQMQINPHFLYNTLDAIAWMAKIKKQPEIETLVINLAKFFRISLHKGDKYIKISEEAELIGHFLEIEKIRFPNTLNYVCNIPKAIGEYKTLKLILQPIVENSIKHGFEGREEVGTITVNATEDGDDVVVEVSDDGCGFEVTENFWTQKTDKPNGFGLYNVNERIRLEYGEGYGLAISSTVGVGTTVKVRIKKRL